MRSYDQGPDTPLLDITTGEQLARTAARFPGVLALVSRHQDKRFTWAQLLNTADRLAHGLATIGIEPGDRVGVWAMNCWEWVALQLACARAGAVLVIVNPASRQRELSYILDRSRMKAIFLREKDERISFSGLLAQVRAEGAFALEHAICFGSPRWESLLAETPRATAAKIDPHDVTNIQYTSGTTGSPKGVLLTHHNLVNNGNMVTRTLRYTEHDRICLAVPLSHCFGNVLGGMASLTSGCAMILSNWSFDARAVLEAAGAERATSIYGVPTMFIAELRHPDRPRFDLTSLRTGIMAGAPCPIEVMRQVTSDMHCPELTIGYGLTEASPLITMSACDDDLELRVTTVGKAMPCTEVKVVAVDTGDTVERGVQGEVCARGYMVMKGYDNDPEATAHVIDPDGWLHTGDLGVMRDDGYLKITGRAKDMIIRGGENIYPREIEEFLYTHPKIAEVQVTGLPNEKLGEIVLAWIRLKPDETSSAQEIKEFCKGHIAYFKIPESIRFVDTFPTTVSGKIQKFRMREIEIQQQQLEAAAQTKMA